MSIGRFWFSQRTPVYKKKILRNAVSRKNQEMIVDWNDCSIQVLGKIKTDKVRIILRTNTNINSDYVGQKSVNLRYMLGIDINKITEPIIEKYSLSNATKDLCISNQNKVCNPSKKNTDYAQQFGNRYVFQLGESSNYRYWIWEWVMENTDIKDTNIYKMYKEINNCIENFDTSYNSEFFLANLNKKELDPQLMDIVTPVIYQPAMDSLKNFVREIHCVNIEDNTIEVTIIFENEQLRKFKYLDWIYKKYRYFFYGRIKDIETFRIHKDVSKKFFTFHNIYSAKNDIEYNIEYDTIHGDNPAVERPIKYYFIDYNHPIIFINTSNHAMAAHDNNHDLWKWEYISFITKEIAPIKYGTKSRKEIDKDYPKGFSTIINILKKKLGLHTDS